MGDIGEESQPLLVHRLFLLTLPPFQFEGIAQRELALVRPYDIADQDKGQEGVDRISPPGAPEGRCDDDGEPCVVGLFPVLTP